MAPPLPDEKSPLASHPQDGAQSDDQQISISDDCKGDATEASATENAVGLTSSITPAAPAASGGSPDSVNDIDTPSTQGQADQSFGPGSPAPAPVLRTRAKRRYSGTFDTRNSIASSERSSGLGGRRSSSVASSIDGGGGDHTRPETLLNKMQRRLSGDGSSSLIGGRRNSDAASSDDGRSRRSSVASRASRRSSGGLLSWGRMATKKDMWASVSDFGDDNGVGDELKYEAKSCTASMKRTVMTAVHDPVILVATLVTLAALLSAGLVTISALADAYSSQLQDDAVDTANELGMWISSQLDQALLPLFSMSQFVKHLDDFKQLPSRIGPRGEPGSAPPLLGKEVSHRNVSGICDDPDVMGTFNEIASNVKKDAGMEGILVNIQLAPQSVVCLLHPLVNAEDFEDGIVMDNTGAWGHDLLNDPNRVAIARATVPAAGVVIAGPLTLIQGDTPVVKEAFIARLAINMEGYNISLDGVNYPCWGFAVILLNWAALKEKSGIDEMFRREGLQYRLTRTDIKTDKETGRMYEQVATIAESAESSVLGNDNSVSVDLDTTNNIWKMTVGYPEGFAAPWLKGVTALVVILSFFISVLLMTILVAKKDMKTLLYKMMPPMVVKKLRRGETVVQRYDLATIFFSDIVGFTKMSGQMSPFQVMDMLNDMYSAFDELVQKHNVYKVETIGDAYIVIGGGPDYCFGRTGAEKVALFALDAMEVCQSLRAKNGAKVCIRAGLASGPVVAGVVGKTRPKFTLFGDTVNFASRMESTSVKMRIQCSDMTYRLLMDASKHEFELEKRIEADGEVGVFAKGKGQVSTWWINGAIPRIGGGVNVDNIGKVPVSYDKMDSLDTLERAEQGLTEHQETDGDERRRSITFEDEISQRLSTGLDAAARNYSGNFCLSDSEDDESVDEDGQKKQHA